MGSKLTLIVAMAENGVIGRSGDLPWRLPADLKRFKRLTMGHPILMGRTTWDSIGRPLPGRRSVVLSRQVGLQLEGAEVHCDLDSALSALASEPQIDVIGGAQIYRLALPRVQRLEMTRVHTDVPGDTYFPEVDWSSWKRTLRERHEADARNAWPYTFETWDRLET